MIHDVRLKTKYTYGSCTSGEIFRIISRNLLSQHQTLGFCGWLFTFNILNKMHKITATAAKIAVDIMATDRPKVLSKSKTINFGMPNQLTIFQLQTRLSLCTCSLLYTLTRRTNQHKSGIWHICHFFIFKDVVGWNQWFSFCISPTLQTVTRQSSKHRCCVHCAHLGAYRYEGRSIERRTKVTL